MNTAETLIKLFLYDEQHSQFFKQCQEKSSNWQNLELIPEDDRTYIICYICVQHNHNNLLHVPLKIFENIQSYWFYDMFEKHSREACNDCKRNQNEKNLFKHKLENVELAIVNKNPNNFLKKSLALKYISRVTYTPGLYLRLLKDKDITVDQIPIDQLTHLFSLEKTFDYLDKSVVLKYIKSYIYPKNIYKKLLKNKTITVDKIPKDILTQLFSLKETFEYLDKAVVLQCIDSFVYPIDIYESLLKSNDITANQIPRDIFVQLFGLEPKVNSCPPTYEKQFFSSINRKNGK